jgi:hypothetical protein
MPPKSDTPGYTKLPAVTTLRWPFSRCIISPIAPRFQPAAASWRCLIDIELRLSLNYAAAINIPPRRLIRTATLPSFPLLRYVSHFLLHFRHAISFSIDYYHCASTTFD